MNGEMEPLAMVTDETEYEPESSNPDIKWVEYPVPEPLAKGRFVITREGREYPTVLEVQYRKGYHPYKVIKLGYGEVAGFDTVEEARETLQRMVQAKSIHPDEHFMGNPGIDEPGEPQGSNFHTLMLHAVAEMFGPGGIVIDEAKAKATSCECVEYKPDKFWCTSRGIVGALTDEQEKIYCNPREIVEKPGVKERMIKWGEAVEICRAQLPPTDGRTRLEIYLDCMSRELTKTGVEA